MGVNMMKKIFSIMVICIFLLTSISTFTASSLKTQKTNTVEEYKTDKEKEHYIDLTIEYKNVEQYWTTPPDFQWPYYFIGYKATVTITNIGTEKVPAETEIKIHRIAIYEGEEVYSWKHEIPNWWWEIGHLNPGESFDYGIFWADGIPPDIKVKSGSTLIAIINPDHDIAESNYDNNKVEEVGELSREYKLDLNYKLPALYLFNNLRYLI
jgi:hypothetical protein